MCLLEDDVVSSFIEDSLTDSDSKVTDDETFSEYGEDEEMIGDSEAKGLIAQME